MADDRLYLRSETGTMLLIEPSREGLVVRGRFEQPEPVINSIQGEYDADEEELIERASKSRPKGNSAR